MAASKPKPKRKDELTEGKHKARAKEQGQLQRENEREQGWDNIRKFLQAGTDININNPVIESELLRTTKELLDIVDKAQAEPLLVSRYDQQRFYTGLDRCKKLYLKAKQKVPPKGNGKRKNVGRPKVDLEEAQKRRDLKASWEQSRVAKISKATFCEDKKIKVEYLNNSVLRWCRDHP